jgi:RNA polymerase sigma factor (sigma-70 family)
MQFFPDYTDEHIAELARQRNPEYFGDLVVRYQDRLFRFVRSIVSDPEAARDITQEAFERAFVALNAFDIRKSFKTWIFTIAKNQAFSYLRWHRNRKTVPLEIETSQGESTSEIEIPDMLPTANEQLIRRQDQEHVRMALQKIKPAYRAALTLFYLEEMSYQEISKLLGIGINTVRTNIRRAKIALARELGSTDVKL